ncbi:hypothetical protein PULV_a1254 [Pseudoalteromonas ulvae UL12]|uniref:Uncharacterized protein n=1 Tax=Pseudoalteromonas ulvae TaxID=107327 RepID=A0A244CSL5_PSEDV|nr:hypothetical protein [Pseudoalteromonas ulvae]MBE0363765.1 hypothetical protein [Pseudoalteromonas ulvae UL12]OUL58607.1 hypothetical protein B1199_09825 [Pseudoalteromonas ulvae]
MGSASITRFIVLIIVIQSLISGCASQKDLASERHRATVEKFKALSEYSESLITQQGIYVVGNIQHAVSDSGVSYTLKDIRLSHQENEYSFNLLTPSFYGKYSCSDVCVLINQYDIATDNQGMTILERFFTENEHELYAFYSDFYLLNKNLELMTDKNRYFVFSYLRHLTQNENTFSSIENFSLWFKRETSLDAFTEYLSKVELISSQDIASFHVDFIEPSLLTSNNSDEVGLTVVSESLDEVLVSKVDEEQLTFKQYKTTDELLVGQSQLNRLEPEIAQYSDIEEAWLVLNTYPKHESIHFDIPATTMDEQLIAELSFHKDSIKSKVDLSANDVSQSTSIETLSYDMTVCTSQENYIGKVVSVEKGDVIIDLIGQAQYEDLEGLRNYPSGILTRLKQEVMIIQLNGEKIFPISDVTPCKIKGV